MILRRVDVKRERQAGEGAQGAYYLGDIVDLLPSLLEAYAGKAQCVYLDPPFATGKKFIMRTRVGEKEWKSGAGTFLQTAYEDNQKRDDYLAMMRAVLAGCHELLCDSGLIFLHIDYRMHARLRLMMDEIFGEDRLLNEIIWAYQTGGRARRFFPRKHDIILMYSKSAKYYFDLASTGVVKPGGRDNHMKRHVDPDGRVYRSIRSGGKVYTYYDDEPVYPGDVWDDVSHMQQKDPQRTGYDTQKPLALMERILRCSTRPGDLVMDLFAGSGTTLVAAQKLGRRYVGADKSPLSLQVSRNRLEGGQTQYEAPACEGAPQVDVRALTGVGYYEIELTQYQVESGVSARIFPGLDALVDWSAGYLHGDVFTPLAAASRAKDRPHLETHLRLPVLTGTPVIRLSDVLGRYFYYELDKDGFDI